MSLVRFSKIVHERNLNLRDGTLVQALHHVGQADTYNTSDHFSPDCLSLFHLL